MTKSQNILSLAFLLLLAFIPVSAVCAPRGVAFIPGLIGLIFLVAAPFAFKDKIVFSKTLIGVVLGICALAMLSALWSSFPYDSFGRAARTSLSMVISALLITAAQNIRIDTIKSRLWILPAALFASATLVFIDMKTGQHLLRLSHNKTAADLVLPAEYNRATTIITLLFFPCMAILRDFISWPKIIALIAIFIGPMLVTTDSQSTQMAFILALIFWVAFPYRIKAVWIAMAITLAAVMAASPFLVIWIFDHLAKDIDSIPMFSNGAGYGGARLEIWDYVSRYMLQKPLTGFGFEATRQVTAFDSHQLYQKGTTILHPHNFAIQIWMEFGAIGIVVAAGLLGAMIMHWQKTLSVAQSSFILPTMIATLSIASMTYGIWQGWWLGTLFTVFAVCILALRLDQDKLPARV